MTDVRLGRYQLGIAEGFGPRIVSLRRDGGPEVLARLGPESLIEYPGGTYSFHGGHRVWAAPELPDITYASEEHPCTIQTTEGKVRISAPPDGAGLVKEMELEPDEDGLLVKHSISSEATGWNVAAWGITQLPLGGVAVVPFKGEETSPLPNRQLVLWPYTSIADDRLQLADQVVRIQATGQRAIKIGVGPQVGRLGYLRNGQLFTKELVESSPGIIPDFGAAGQVYVGQGFCELETVGGLVDTSVESATSTERWSIASCDDLESAERMVLEGGGG